MNIEPRLAYNYAIVDRASKMCIEVRTSSAELSSNDVEILVLIPSYNYDYLMKYYDESTGKWYLDTSFTTEWNP